MKNNLGRLIIFVLYFVSLDASEYRWSASINKDKAYVNEAVHLHYRCEFDSKDELHVIEFNPVGSYKDYDIYLLSESESIEDGKRVNDFEFVAFLKKSAKVEFDFDVLMKKTNQDSIENTVLGRDNAEVEQFSKKLIKQKTLSLEVLKNDSELFGDFEFKIKKDEPSVDAYEPYHFEIIIEGTGNLDKLKPVELNIPDAKVFASEPKKEFRLFEDGYSGIWSQKFAIVSSKNFDFPNIKYRYFSKKSNKIEKYVLAPFRVEVKKLYKKDELLDNVEKQKIFFKKEYVYYMLVFMFGFLAGKIKFKTDKTHNGKKAFEKKLEEVGTLDELSVFLVINDLSKYSDIVNKIETQQISLSKAKKLVKKYLNY